MSSFRQLWEDSLRVRGAAEQQQYVRDRIAPTCQEHGLRFWNGEPPVPEPSPTGLLIGVGAYDRNDLDLLDRVAGHPDPLDVVVFLLDTLMDIAPLQSAFPEAQQPLSQNPIAAVWQAGLRPVVACGYAGRMLVGKLIAPARRP